MLRLLRRGCIRPTPETTQTHRAKPPQAKDCVIPEAEHWILDWSPPELASLTIRGHLTWDTNMDSLQLTAGFVLVEGKGRLEVGTVNKPMSKLAIINLTDAQAAPHPTLGTRFLAGQDKAHIKLHGQPLGTWTLLAKDVASGDSELHLREDPRSLSWRVGDEIGIATTSRGQTRPYTIVSLGPEGSNTVTIDPPAATDYWGGWQSLHYSSGRSSDFNRSFELAAEVVNLQRSVVITGPPNWDTADWKGLHTLMTGSEGFMDARYVRVENCGQPPHQGNSADADYVEISTGDGERATVSNNILWNTMSAGVYVEDGNEMNNTFQENVVICMHEVPPLNPLPCNKGDTGICPEARQGCTYDMFNQGGRLGGFFVIGMTNNFVRNRVVNMENCIWFKGSADPAGRGHAAGKVCPMHLPFGQISGNVCHDNRRFGIYLDFQSPRMIPRDENGFVADIADPNSNCFNEVTPDGRDSGLIPANIVEDELDWHNEFVGQYTLSDVRYLRYVGINNMHCMYWKSSKKFADGGLYHVRDSMCINVPAGGLFEFPAGQFLGPAGSFTFGMKNVSFVGSPGVSGALSAGQHCMDGGAGGPCNVQYLLEDVNFSHTAQSGKFIQFGVNSKPEGLSVWTAAALAGEVQLSGPGFAGAPNNEFPIYGGNAGLLSYATNYNGYGALAIPGQVYELNADWRSSPVIDIDFSDDAMGDYFGED
ncbi:unnamed protein product [Symbiodinium pilosum]|uniref:G8 domain-containing protein n=1 Tax=Symbiodinium pilosum TaxID=2952 RepID=A0A812JVI5_SYMPI|nr:unnamed protein product [Symbiodinium pilosum]